MGEEVSCAIRAGTGSAQRRSRVYEAFQCAATCYLAFKQIKLVSAAFLTPSDAASLRLLWLVADPTFRCPNCRLRPCSST